MPTLKKNLLVKKRNVMIGLRPNSMTLQEMRFLSIYLSRIHRDLPEKTRVVRFPIEEFRSIMGLGRVNIEYLKSVTNSLLCKVVNVPIEDENGRQKGYSAFQLFKECTVNEDEGGKQYVEIDAHDKALPLMFDYKNRYTTYPLYEFLRLRSPNQQKLYEFLKQYAYTKERTVVATVEELKAQMGMEDDEYGARWDNFKRRVLEPCRQAIMEYTDIKFTYEPYGKRGKGNKILNLKFFIEENDNTKGQLALDDFTDDQQGDDYVEGYEGYDEDWEGAEEGRELSVYDRRIEFFREACTADDGNPEFSEGEMRVLYDEMMKYISEYEIRDARYCYHYLQERYNEMRRQNEKKRIRSRFGYMKSLIGKEF